MRAEPEKFLLKHAFQKSRETGNIEEILPAFISSNLFIAGKKISPEQAPVFFLQRSPNPERFCITVSESKGLLSRVQGLDIIESSGLEILRSINESYEIVVVYTDGGDYLTREQIAYFKQIIES